MSSRCDATIPSSSRAATRASTSVDATQTRGLGGAAVGRGDRRPELLEAASQPVGERAHVRLDRGDADLGHDLHPDGPGIERGHRRRTAVEPSCGAVRRVVGDRHLENVLVGEPAGLGGEQGLDERAPDPHEPEPGRAEQVLDGSTRHDIGAERAHVDLDRPDRLVAVGEYECALGMRDVGDRGYVVAVAGAERNSGAADECRALVHDLGEALGRDRAVGFWRDVHDLGAPQRLRVCDLADGRELVLADDDAVPLTAQVEGGHERADPLRDGRRDRDLVRVGMDEAREAGASGFVPLDPELPLRAVFVPAAQPLLDRRTNTVRERALRARVEVDGVLEDRKLRADRVPDAHRPRYAFRRSSFSASSDAFPSSTIRPVDST